ncbi:MAG: (Fe-S)-binding protein [Methanomassiliicoccales archaeon]
MAEIIEAQHLRSKLKTLLTCTYCGFCKSVCPVFEGVGWDPSVARGRMILSYGLLQKEIPADPSVVEALFQCTTCKDCERRCPSSIEVVEVVENARKDLVANGIILPSHKKVITNILSYGNPYGERDSVAQRIGIKPRNAEVGYFIGCTSAYRNRKSADATVSLLHKLGVNFTLLDEVCCGSVMQRIGWNEDDLISLMERNLKAIEASGADEVIFSCAGCYRMFKEEYPKFLKINFKVKHVSEFLSERDLKLLPLSATATYHDPCHLGRHCGVFDPPRKVLSMIPQLIYKEMPRNKDTARCCGGGGGVRSAFPDLSAKIAARRVAEASFAEYLITSCPFCVNNLSMGKELTQATVKVIDLVEFVDLLLKGRT